MSDNFQVITSDYVKVDVTNSQNAAVSLEQKFAKSLTIEELKVCMTQPHLKYGHIMLLIVVDNHTISRVNSKS